MSLSGGESRDRPPSSARGRACDVACKFCGYRIRCSGCEFADAASGFEANRRVGVAYRLCEDGSHARAVSSPEQLGPVGLLLMGSGRELGHRGIGFIGTHSAERDRDDDVGTGHVGTGPEALPRRFAMTSGVSSSCRRRSASEATIRSYRREIKSEPRRLGCAPGEVQQRGIPLSLLAS